eukprot:14058977-Alexandrium_andersonii.AAC.1
MARAKRSQHHRHSLMLQREVHSPPSCAAPESLHRAPSGRRARAVLGGLGSLAWVPALVEDPWVIKALPR